MKADKELASDSFLSHELLYKVNTDRRSYEDGFVEGLKQDNKALGEAKAIIKELLNVFVYDLTEDELDSGDVDVRTKAEKFLKEVES